MSVTRGTLAEALDMTDLQLLNGADEVSLPRDAAELVARALHADSELIAAAAERDALAAKVERVRALADLIDRHTEYERDPVDFRDASHGGSWDDVADRIRRALDEEAQP